MNFLRTAFPLIHNPHMNRILYPMPMMSYIIRIEMC